MKSKNVFLKMVKAGHKLFVNDQWVLVTKVEKLFYNRIRLLDENGKKIIEGHINERVNPRKWYIPGHYIIPGNYSIYPGSGFKPRPKFA